MKDVVFVDSAEAFLGAIESMPDVDFVVPVFKGWPVFDVTIRGDRYEKTLTPKLMIGFIEFQDQLLRAYTELKYGSPSLQKLTQEEKDDLELIFQISKGSTNGQGGLDEALNKLLSALPMKKMSGGQVTAFLIVAVLSFAGYKVFVEWNQADLEKAKLASADKGAQTQTALVGKLAEALVSQKLPNEAVVAKERATEGYRSIIAGAPDASSIDIQGDHYNADELAMIRAQNVIPKSRLERREDVYIDMVKRHPTYLSLTLRLPGESYTFPGRVELDKFDQEKVNDLFDALRDASPLRVFHHSVEISGRITRTDVLAVDDVTSSSAPPPSQ
ncbi:hypothetical protein IBL38_08150 [Pseudomonas syringae pv. syringae]|uniref:hypothetical protein n=1 Tax=Pseudomonas syringae TaxID=317 RepID=UPI00165A04D3|nr:hypothetical protein [Pseudomonas syringae]MBC9743258.1 hypothetical protein [Pseudomonas syringae pv. syringae]MBC9747269.1 hypothetical protein [Pseudomonas syringae pv. syringae]MCK9720944.1 hypothetical protein [Pseudomonas syringae pv. syringae]